LRAAFEQRGLPPPVVAVSSVLAEYRLHVVAATNLLGHSSLPVVRDCGKGLGISVLRIEDWEPVRRASTIIYRKGAYLSPAARRLIELLKSSVRRPG
jgi:DNA-binding transcriptional LysR family regulator